MNCVHSAFDIFTRIFRECEEKSLTRQERRSHLGYFSCPSFLFMMGCACSATWYCQEITRNRYNCWWFENIGQEQGKVLLILNITPGSNTKSNWVCPKSAAVVMRIDSQLYHRWQWSPLLKRDHLWGQNNSARPLGLTHSRPLMAQGSCGHVMIKRPNPMWLAWMPKNRIWKRAHFT